MTILLISVVLILVFLFGLLVMFIFTGMDRTITTMRTEIEADAKAYNPGVTMGHKIKPAIDFDDQLVQARQLAAMEAASLPRGANNRIGRAGQAKLVTAGKGLKNDPLSAVRIARFHGWDGARSGAPSVGAAGAAVATPVATAGGAPATAGIAPPTLITITDAMSPDEVRKARIANAKAQSAYQKALKSASAGAPAAAVVAPVAAGVTVPASAPAAAPAAPIAGIEPPALVEITPDMAPQDVRKARIANAKAEAAYNKALKAAGAATGMAASATQPEVQATPVATAPAEDQTPPAVSAQPATPGIEPPQLREITESMSPDEIRRARIENAKATSAYNKALKAAGIDPASVK